MRTKKPWLSADGQPLIDSELKVLSKAWTPDEWERYLQSLEHPENEGVVHLDRPETLEYKSTEDFRVLISNPLALSEEQREALRNAIRKLPPRQEQVIRDCFWGGMTEKEQAELCGIQRVSVYGLKKRALKNLKNF